MRGGEERGSRLTRWDTPAAPMICVAMAYAVFLLIRLGLTGFDPSYFITAGADYVDVQQAPANLTLHENPRGYDGQFFYRFALDPLTSESTEHGIRLDLPAYRQQRIGYPLLVWAFSLGRPALVPAMLILVNYLGLCILGWLGGKYAQILGKHALWGLALALYPGFMLTLARDLSEIVAACFLVAALLAVRAKRTSLAAVLLALCVLTRETTLIVVAALLLAGFINTVWKREDLRWAWYFLPCGVYAVWQLVLYWNWGQSSFHSHGGTFGLPFAGILGKLRASAALSSRTEIISMAELALLLAHGLVTLWALRACRALPGEWLAWLFYAGLAALLGYVVWNDDWNYLRVLSEFYVLSLPVLLASRIRVIVPLFSAWALLWLFLFLTRSELHHLVSGG